MPRLIHILVPAMAILLSGCGGQTPQDLGINNDGILRPCPDKPNCVQTYVPADSTHYVSPLALKDSLNNTRQAIEQAITSTGGYIKTHRAVSNNGHYLHAEYQSRWLKFIDDVEVLITDNAVHIRSASRVGYSDLGVNTERYQQINESYRKYK